MKKEFLLDAGWKLWSTPHDDVGAPESIPEDSDVLDVDLPEDVHAALRRAGQIPDYHIGDNYVRCQWVTDKDWYFQKVFRLPPDWPEQGAALLLDGLDLFGHVWLNGRLLGRTSNAFLPARFGVEEWLKRDGTNTLTVRIESLAKRFGREGYTVTADDWDAVRTLARKPQFSFGWDWAPPLPGVGLDHVRLISHAKYEIRDVHIRPHISGRVDVFAEMSDQVPKGMDAKLQITLEGHGFSETKSLKPTWPETPAARRVDASVDITKRVQAARFFTTFTIEHAKLWWPNGYGHQPLYHYRVTFCLDGEEGDVREGRFGIREVRVYEQPFEGGGMTWGLEVNGRKILVRGANWIPCNIFPYLQKKETYDAFLSRALEANFNMLRVWGGGTYERTPFYDFCDEHGIMVWQDFMFASAAYGFPDDAFRTSVMREAEYHVRRLRNRACVALWCGCNEDSHSWSFHGDVVEDAGGSLRAGSADSDTALRDQEKELYSMVLRGTVSRLTDLPYVESSPQSHGDYGNDPLSGNSHHSCHKYAINHTAPRFREHFQTVTSFNSEFCTQGPARKRTLERFLPPDHRWPPNEVWTRHIARGHYNIPHHELQQRFAAELFGPVDSLEKLCRYGMAVHAEFTRAEFESVRHWRGKSGGTMVWMLNDCWPTSNWALFDYDNIPKAAFYAAKRAAAPTVLVLFPAENGNQVILTLCNQSQRALSGTVRCGTMRISGESLQESSNSVSVHPYQSTTICSMAAPADPNIFLWADADLGPVRIERITYFANLWKDVSWPSPDPTVTITEERHEGDKFITRVRVQTKRYARFLHFDIEPLGETVLSDNFFDLVGGDEKAVEITTPRQMSQQDIHIGHWLTKWT